MKLKKRKFSSTNPIPIPMFKLFLFHNAFGLSTTPLYQFSIRFFNNALSQPFVVSYLIHKFGFSHEFALKAFKQLYFKTSQKPDSVLDFFKFHGFNDSDITASSKENPSFFHEMPTKEFYQSFNFYSPKVLLPLTLFVWL